MRKPIHAIIFVSMASVAMAGYLIWSSMYASSIESALREEVKRRNAAAVNKNPTAAEVELQFSYDGRGEYKYTLRNVGKRDLMVVHPSYTLTIFFYFYDWRGQLLELRNKIAMTLPRPGSFGGDAGFRSLYTLRAGDAWTVPCRDDQLNRHFEGMKDVKYVVAYYSADHRVTEDELADYDLRGVVLSGGPVRR
ncbi:MAG: hypothetical protein ACR2HJ_09305 [Fimbriimonadales bacterium]